MIGAVLALGAAAATTGSASAQEGDGIVVYNAQHESLTKAWADGFTKRDRHQGHHPQRQRHANSATSSSQEGAASPADVFLTENSPAMALVDSAGLFAPVDADTLAQVPAGYRPADGNWIGIAARTTVFAYDKRKLTADELPKSLLDLADPSWKGRWAASPSGADFQAIVGALLAAQGRGGDRGLAEGDEGRTSIAYRGNGTAMKARQHRRGRWRA